MTPPAEAASTLTPADRSAILLALMCVMMLAALESTIVAPAMPSIGRDLGNVEQMAWIVTAYLIVATALTPLYGKLADIKGRRIVLLFAAISFLLGSLACALSSNMLMLILARGLQGVGGGGIFAMTQTIIGDIVPARDRARFQVYTSTVWLLANVMGPVLGGILTEYWHWSMIFWINLPFGIPALLVIWPKLKKLPRHERPHSLDIIGALLIIIATVLIMLALSWGGTRYAWSSIEMITLIAASLGAWALLTLRQLTAHEPLIPVSVLGNSVVRNAVLTSFFAMAAYIGVMVWMPVYLQTIGGMSVTAAGLATMPLMVFSTLGAQAGARAMRRGRGYQIIPLVGMALAAIGTFGLAVYAAGMPLWLLGVLTTIISAGMGAIFPMLTVTLQSAVAPHDLGSTMALNVFMRSLGSAIGVAVLGALLIGYAGAAALEMHGVPGAASPELIKGFVLAYAASGFGFVLAFVYLLRMGAKPLPGHSGLLR